jgi:hypothetical protein
MIIELFGPQGVGKTTFARALADRLKEQGQAVDLVLSYRPAERWLSEASNGHAARSRATAVASRLTRPFVELLTMTRHPLALYGDAGNVSKLLKALPQKHFLQSARMSQYLLRLSHAWHLASESDQISLFDQAFVQAIHSLILFGKIVDECQVEQALDAIPRCDALIQLHAPQEILDARLHDRQRGQSLAERMLEIDPKTNAQGQRIFDQLRDLLRQRGQSITAVCSSDPVSLADAVNSVSEQITGTTRVRNSPHRMVAERLATGRYGHV